MLQAVAIVFVDLPLSVLVFIRSFGLCRKIAVPSRITVSYKTLSCTRIFQVKVSLSMFSDVCPFGHS